MAFPSIKHYAFADDAQLIVIRNDKNQSYEIRENSREQSLLPELRNVKIFSLEPKKAGMVESIEPNPKIQENGEGVVRVLDALKTGDREDLFLLIEKTFKQYIPDIKKLSFTSAADGKRLQIREKHLPRPIPGSLLSEGTQLALMLITLLQQEHKPSLVCIEDIDRGLHPRLFQSIVELCFDLSKSEHGVQIIATTHNPYLVDEFKDHEDAVIIVEKENGQTTFTTLSERLERLDPEEEPLGSLWYSGFVGGVPKRA